MRSPRTTVSYSLSTYHYYPPGVANPASPSAPPPSHSDSPSPSRSGSSRSSSTRPPLSRNGSIPRHWRKVTYTIVAEDLESDEETCRRTTPASVKKEAVRKWLQTALAPYLELQSDGLEGLRPSEVRDLKKVLHDTVESVVKKRQMVERIWRLKKVQGR